MTRVSMINAADNVTIARWLTARLQDRLRIPNSQIAITVPGGSTPFPILEAVLDGGVDWRRITVWPGDDRLVADDHPASNTGRMRALLEPAGAKIEVLTEGLLPPRFALTWLGMGEDGHIASLFPNTDPQEDDRQLVRRLTPDPLPPEAPYDRITLTIPALLNSDHLLFVLRGEAKRALFTATVRGDNDLPVARLLRNTRQHVTCFC